MSSVEHRENHAGIQRLQKEISKLREQQIAAEKIAALSGMTPEDSERYKERDSRMKKLTRKLGVLDSAQGDHHEKEEIAGEGAESGQADRSR